MNILERENHLSMLRRMRDDIQWLVSSATALDRRRVDQHQLSALSYAIGQLQATPGHAQGLRNALIDIAEHSSDEGSRRRAVDALAHEEQSGPWNRARPHLDLSVEESSDLAINGRAGSTLITFNVRRTGLAAYAWHEESGSSGHGDVAFKPEVYSVLRTISSPYKRA